MPYPIERKLVVGISSNALFDLEKEDQIFQNQGVEKYKEYQIEHRNDVIDKGLAFPFVKKYLKINDIYSDQEPVEVVLMSKNSPEAGVRIFNSIEEYSLDITRAAFTSGDSPYKYIPSYNVSLFLSTHEIDVLKAIEEGYPAGRIVRTNVTDDEDEELKIAFDFDGVIADDEAEAIYKETDQLNMFHKHEVENVGTPHNPGPLAPFFKKISFFQEMENRKKKNDPDYEKILKTAILTSRNAPSHERAIKTLEEWDVTVDNLFLMGGVEKRRILEEMKPHLFIDDQIQHLDEDIEDVTLVHIPFGVANESEEDDG